ncbi:MAG: gamma-glutamyl-gamma-aminobutyrate hydrolase family protein [Actinobacteria bacterium]|nr:gamma-glutamyl-gamma-aminobutyrate hydrolase family protein [Actinomycetota bacterium]
MLFVLTEHAGALTSERRERYETWRGRLAEVLGTQVKSVHYEALETPNADALVLSGSFDAWAMHDRRHLGRLYEALRRYPGPVLGICAGMQILVRARGGVVGSADQPVRGYGTIDVVDDSDLLARLAPRFDAFQSHADEVTRLPEGFRVLASSEVCEVEVIAADDRPWWGTQFHPEQWTDEHPAGREIIARFGELAGLSAASRGA